jgi:hydrogenase maturation protease
MKNPEVLIACIGNIFLGDDGFGTEVARELAERSLPPGVVVKDFGIRGFDLTYALLDPYRLMILVDACQRDGRPGTLYLLEPDPIGGDATSDAPPRLYTHAMNPMAVLRVVHSLGGSPARILIVGCEPADTGTDEGDGKLGLSEPVQAAVGEAIALIERTISGFLGTKQAGMKLQLVEESNYGQSTEL